MSVENGPGPEFLKQKYDLHNSPEVESAKERAEERGEEIAENPDATIQNYLNRFTEITERENPERRERGIEALKKVMHDKFIVKADQIPDSFWEAQKRIIRERGQGADLEQVDFEQLKRQNTEAIITDQTASLDNWIDYLTSSDATYPDWLKYWTFRSVTTMGGFDKERHAFSKRSAGTTKPFPDINREALAYVLDTVEKKYSGREIDNLEGEEKAEFQNLLTSENFSKLYAWAIEKVTPASVEQITITEGQWVKYDQGSDHMPLVQSLQGHGTGWCTAGESTAVSQLKGGDFYVYYSLDQQNQPTIPRAAIRMEEGKIAEVRGIAAEQNLDPYIAYVVKEKLDEFPDGKAHEKKTSDMQKLTEIDRKTSAGEQLNAEELRFLYEIDAAIDGFGYNRDPRIEEIRSKRNPKEDAPIVLVCQPNEIAWNQNEITDQTKAYIGPLFAQVFQMPKIENIFTSFPDGIVRKGEREIGGETKEEFDANVMQELKRRGVNISSGAQSMEQSAEFTVQENREIITTIRLKVRDLGFTNSATTEQIYARAEEFGLELCPAEVGPRQRLADMEQPRGQWYSIAMKPIAYQNGNPCVFYLDHNDDGLWLRSNWTPPTDKWYPDCELMFRLRKLSSES